MKKILFLMFAIANLTFVGCSDDDGDAIASLNGTKWVSMDLEYDCYDSLEFGETTFEWFGMEGDYADMSSGTYTYNPPIVKFKEKGLTYEGRVSGDKMVVGEKTYTLKK